MASSPSASVPTSDDEDDAQPAVAGGKGLSAYEQQRLANIARNHATLESLGLLDAAAALRPKAVRKPRV